MEKKTTRLRRARRGRAHIRKLGASRLCVHRTPRHIYAQIIAAEGDKVLASASTVLADVHHEMLVMQEETFGPVLPIMRVRTEEEALALANQSRDGLNANVWTRNRRKGTRLAKAIRSGGASFIAS